ncbi:MAG: vitamin B12 dependent-methionine synthase activation domain-containing protein, partial [Deltaproteobacteria bacterium]
DRLRLHAPDGQEVMAFDLPRQPKPNGLCLADLVNPAGPAGEPQDHVALFVVTAGKGVRARAEELKEKGDYLRSHALQALALESAEGYAELLHAQLRSQWGFPDPLEATMADRFRASYRGKRYSFGYPACPALEDQQKLFALLRPEEIGVELTDGDMMDPEASVSALVFHHPEASYFSASARE